MRHPVNSDMTAIPNLETGVTYAARIVSSGKVYVQTAAAAPADTSEAIPHDDGEFFFAKRNSDDEQVYIATEHGEMGEIRYEESP